MNRLILPVENLKWIVPAIAILALAIRLAPLFRGGDDWAKDIDSPRYLQLAEGMRSGCGFARLVAGKCYPAEVLRTPGYPAVLMMMPNARSMLVLQAVIGALVCLLIGKVVARYWGLMAGAMAALMLGLDVPSIVNGDRIMSDGLFQALVASAICLEIVVIGRGKFDRRSVVYILGAALISAAAILVRPIGLTLPVLLGTALFATDGADWKKKVSIAVLAVMIPSAAYAGWTLRNREQTGVATISTDGAIVFYYFNAAKVTSQGSGEPFQQVQEEFSRKIGWNFGNYMDTPASIQPTMISNALAVYLHDPIGVAVMTARSFIWLLWLPDADSNLAPFLKRRVDSRALASAPSSIGPRIRNLLHSRLLAVLVMFQFATMAVMWTGIIRAIRSIRRNDRRATVMILFLLGAAVLILAPAAMPAAMSRYRVPAMPMFAMLCGIGYFGRYSRDES